MRQALIALLFSVAALAQTETKEAKPLPSLAESIEWLTGASQEEAGWGSGSFQFSSDGKCNAEISTSEILNNRSEKNFRRAKYSFRMSDIDPSDIRFESVRAEPPYNVIHFHTYNYRESISFILYKDAEADWSAKEVEHSDKLRAPYDDLKTNDWFAPRFVKAFKRAVELCGGRKSSY
jgi:hypothetical protein